MEELETVLWEIESACGRAHKIVVSWDFWKRLQLSRHVLSHSNGDISYKYLKVEINPQQEAAFMLY